VFVFKPKAEHFLSSYCIKMTAQPGWCAAGYYMLRSPALPVNYINGLCTDPNAHLQQLWESTSLSEAVFIASVSLHTQVKQHIANLGWPLPPPLLRPLLKYALRMCSRATPFGLMAGCSVGHVRGQTQVRWQPAGQRYTLHRRLDMACVSQLVQQLSTLPGIRKQLRFTTNNSLYTVGHEVRYVDRESPQAGTHYFMSAVTSTTYLQTLLNLAQSGATLDQLVNALLSSENIDSETALAYVEQLIDQQLLVSELDPVLTAPPVLTHLRSKVSQFSQTETVADILDTVGHLLTSPQTTSVVQTQVAASLAPLMPEGTDVPLLQTDLFMNTSANQLGQGVVNTILTQLADLLPLNNPRPSAALHDFKQRFRQRYDQREVPLSEALDGDVGVGYGDTIDGQTAYTPLVSGLNVPAATQQAPLSWGPFEDLALRKYTQVLQRHDQPVELTPDDLTSLKTNTSLSLPSSFYVFGHLLSPSEQAVDQGCFQFNLMAAGGVSAATLLGRFCAHSSELTQLVQETLVQEEAQNPDCVYAEIVHWPQDRAGNVLVRPALRRYEIPYHSTASVPAGQQIPVSDLLVSVLPDDTIRLRSKRLGKTVIPRLSSAHNYQNGLSTYRFLADLQEQNSKMDINWNWGPLDNQPFLPRITYRNLVLSRAKWTWPVAGLPLTSPDALACFLRTSQHVPRWVTLSQGDNELVIDLDAEATRQLLFEETRRLTVLTLVEWINTPDQCWVQDGSDRFVQELVLPCLCPAPTGNRRSAPSPVQAGGLLTCPSRSFEPGSEWLYVKLFTGVYGADELLATVVQPLLNELTHTGLIDTFFFVRYFEPGFHLRLRFHSHVPDFVAPVLSRLNQRLQPYRQSGMVYRVQADTYEREIERYGQATMADSERVFWADSLASLTYLAEEINPDQRWRFALQATDTLLTDFGFTLEAKLRLLRRLQSQFLDEHHADQALRKQLNDRYRAEQRTIMTDLSQSGPWSRVLADRSALIKPLVPTIQAGCGLTTQPALPEMLASYLHMSLNRLFTSKHRTQEMVIYHYLTRYYESANARLSSRVTRIQTA
jgi:thiopeptide-type bacteriocin biosynthesis protein